MRYYIAFYTIRAAMLKVLLIKTSSLGDLIHSMPAVTDLMHSGVDVELHWLVEEGFANVPYWHPLVSQVHCCAIRRWRKSLFKRKTRQEISTLKNTLQQEQFDIVIDAQGLLKTAWMVRWFKRSATKTIGYDKHSIKEPLASRAYKQVLNIAKEQTAIERVRQLFAAAFAYTFGEQADFGLQVKRPEALVIDADKPYAVFLHGTNWVSKIWPVQYWQALASNLCDQGFNVLIPWGDEQEQLRAQQIAQGSGATVLPRCSLNDLAYLLQQASVVIGSDTGLSHIAAALAVPTIGLYGSTNSKLTGLVGKNVKSLQSSYECSPCMQRQCPKVSGGKIMPCYQSISVDAVMASIKELV